MLIPIIYNSRSCIIALIIEFFILCHVRLLKLRKKQIMIISLFMIIFITSLIYYRIGSVKGRWLIYNVLANAIIKNPIKGYGWDAMYKCYMLHQAEYFINNPNNTLSVYANNNYFPFNEFLGIAYRYGVFALTAAIIVIVYLCKRSGKYSRAAILSLSIYSMFSYPFYYNPYKEYVEKLYSLAVRLNENSRYKESDDVLDTCEKYFINYDTEMLRASNAYERTDIVNAEKHYLIAHNMIPNRFAPLYGLMKCYKTTNNPKVLLVAKEIVAKPIKIKSYDVNLIIDEANYILLNDKIFTK